MAKQRIQPAISGLAKQNEIIHAQSGAHTFETKEEFIAHLIRIGEIQKDTRHHEDDGCIYLQGILRIDRRVKPFLNWNDVIVTAAVVEEGMVSRYQYLPRAYQGIQTEMKAPSLAAYMQHNNWGAEFKDDQWFVKKLHIRKVSEHLDFSHVDVAKDTLFSGQGISLSRLPKTHRYIVGLNPYSLEIDCDNAYEVAAAKGCGHAILKTLESTRSKKGFGDFIGYLGSLVGSGRR